MYHTDGTQACVGDARIITSGLVVTHNHIPCLVCVIDLTITAVTVLYGTEAVDQTNSLDTHGQR